MTLPKSQNKKGKALRCAIYTRKSTEHGLELEFNSLDAQREACEAYIRSQAAEGWKLLLNRYDDPAYSGGNLDRPALQTLLSDIKVGRIDIIVVYKIDRLTRSLSDFAKLIEIFDQHKVSFVAITQQFNTTSSMGRLTLNVLLSFAQFERELSSERVRDKIAASRKRGKWTGGGVPLGYDVKNKKLVINEVETLTVRRIFNLYLKQRSIGKLIQSLDQVGLVSKRRTVKGRDVGRIPFTHGPLAHLLKNRIYLGEIAHHGNWFAGEHEPLIEKGLFDQVQQLLQQQSITRRLRRTESGTLLSGILFDDRGNRMSPSFSTKKGVRYRFYISSAVLRSRKHEAGSLSRVPAHEIERAVIDASRIHLKGSPVAELETDAAVTAYINRVELSAIDVKIVIKSFAMDTRNPESECSGDSQILSVPWPNGTHKPLIRIEEIATSDQQVDPGLVQAIVRAHAWVRILQSEDVASIEELATSVGLHPKVVRKSIRLAFLAPEITAAILAGNQPPGLALASLNTSHLPVSWQKQKAAFRFETGNS